MNDKIASMIQLLTDPENQPHQFVGSPEAFRKLLEDTIRPAFRPLNPKDRLWFSQSDERDPADDCDDVLKERCDELLAPPVEITVTVAMPVNVRMVGEAVEPFVCDRCGAKVRTVYESDGGAKKCAGCAPASGRGA